MQPGRNKDSDLIKGKGGFERKRQTARYEAARYMKDSGSEVFGRGVVLLPNLFIICFTAKDCGKELDKNTYISKYLWGNKSLALNSAWKKNKGKRFLIITHFVELKYWLLVYFFRTEHWRFFGEPKKIFILEHCFKKNQANLYVRCKEMACLILCKILIFCFSESFRSCMVFSFFFVFCLKLI